MRGGARRKYFARTREGKGQAEILQPEGYPIDEAGSRELETGECALVRSMGNSMQGQVGAELQRSYVKVISVAFRELGNDGLWFAVPCDHNHIQNDQQADSKQTRNSDSE